ncbi:MAG: hypothetical protein K8R21_01150 [Leptospira sp.]|nr:hypothetical protein [Leptospira sp.]
MRMKLFNNSMLCFFVSQIFFLSCASIHIESNESGFQKKERFSNSYAVRFSGWKYQADTMKSVNEILLKNGIEIDFKSENSIEIVLEELNSGSGALRTLNAIATILSRTIIPFYNRVDYRITYRIFIKEKLYSTCAYELTNREFFGILLLPLTPFLWPPSRQSDLILESVQKYTTECL